MRGAGSTKILKCVKWKVHNTVRGGGGGGEKLGRKLIKENLNLHGNDENRKLGVFSIFRYHELFRRSLHCSR